MKKLTTGVFPSRVTAEEAINALYHDLKISAEDISYVYRNTDNQVQEVEVSDIPTETTAEGAASGAITGGTIGAIAGVATVVGIIPVVGPIFAGGALLTALGIGLAGAAGTTAAAATTGAVAGGLIGALTSLGVSDIRAKEYEDRVAAGDILVTVHAEENLDVATTLGAHGALAVETYSPSV